VIDVGGASSGGRPEPRRRGLTAAWLALGGLAAWLLLVSLLLGASGGLRGRYAIRNPDGTLQTVHERIDARLDFPVPQRIDAAYIFHWNFERFGFPARMPPAVIRWSGLLSVPESGRYGFVLDAQGEAVLRIDERALEVRTDALTEVDLTRGPHRIEVDYAVNRGEARLVLSWQPPGGRLQTVPSRFLAVDAAARRSIRARRFTGRALLAAGLLAVAIVAWMARRREGAAAALVAALGARRTMLALGALLLLAAALRLHDYDLVPFHHETADEYQHAWEGWSLLHDGVPAAWTTFPDRYPIAQTQDFRWFGDRYVVARPYFDHPPLFSLPVGLLSSLVAAAEGPTPGWAAPYAYLRCRLSVMRLVPILFSLAGLLILYHLALHYGASERAALLAALVYAVLPVIVMSHRLVKAESLLALLFMGALLAVARCDRSGKTIDAVLVGGLCGLSLWTKATGIGVLATVLVLLAARRRYRAALIVAGVSAAAVGLYVLYAAAFDFDIFLKVLRAQATTKWVGLEGLTDLLAGKVVVKWFGRGFYLWLLLCAAIVALRRERGLLVPIAIYGMVIALTADQRVIYGWYRIPLYPFLCVAAGICLDTMLREADLYHTFPFSAAAVSTGLLYTLPERLVQSQPAVMLFALVALAPFVLRLAHDRPLTARLARLSTYLLLLLFVGTCVASVGGLLEIYAATRGVR